MGAGYGVMHLADFRVGAAWRWITAQFAWRLLCRRGAWTYIENEVTGQRRAYQAPFLLGPLAMDLLRPGDVVHWNYGAVDEVEVNRHDLVSLMNIEAPSYRGPNFVRRY